MNRVKRREQFVENESGVLYLPRPVSWMHGLSRQAWFKSKVGTAAYIASPEYWEHLKGRYRVKTLVEYHDGSHEVE